MATRAAAAVQAAPAVRIDRWLWAIRLYKSRSLAAEACDGGKVKVNGHTAKPHKLVRAGDAVSVTHPAGRKEFTVVALAERRHLGRHVVRHGRRGGGRIVPLPGRGYAGRFGLVALTNKQAVIVRHAAVER